MHRKSIKDTTYWLNSKIYYGIGIRINDEDYDIQQPISIKIQETICNKQDISSKDLKTLVESKIKFYSSKQKKVELSLSWRKEIGVSFKRYLLNALLDNNYTYHRNFIPMVGLISIIQIFLTAFFSGYVFKHLYKILDNEI